MPVLHKHMQREKKKHYYSLLYAVHISFLVKDER